MQDVENWLGLSFIKWQLMPRAGLDFQGVLGLAQGQCFGQSCNLERRRLCRFLRTLKDSRLLLVITGGAPEMRKVLTLLHAEHAARGQVSAASLGDLMWRRAETRSDLSREGKSTARPYPLERWSVFKQSSKLQSR